MNVFKVTVYLLGGTTWHKFYFKGDNVKDVIKQLKAAEHIIYTNETSHEKYYVINMSQHISFNIELYDCNCEKMIRFAEVG